MLDIPKEVEDLLNNVNGYSLDNQQKNVVINKNKTCLVVAGAGSGKSLTIIGKIRYLIEIEKIRPEEIICISFTNDSVNSLKNSIQKNYHYLVPVYTFHKLALEILKYNNNYITIAEADLLEYIIDEYFNSYLLTQPPLLKMLLYYFNIKATSKNSLKKYLIFNKDNYLEISNFKNLLARFIHLYKANCLNINSFIDFFNKNKGIFYYKQKKKNKIFLIFVWNIFQIYNVELESQQIIDFDDMINKATTVVSIKGFFKKCKYIIIDEYQDTSYTRFNLINNIIKKTGASLLAVGDDFQSIYRFTGCDLNIFTNFNDYFPNSTILKIEQTYRNSQELIDIAGSFIMKNKSQIKKQLRSSKSLKKPIVIVYYSELKEVLEKLINKIYLKEKGSILILGRNNCDIYLALNKNFILSDNGNINYLKNKDIKLRYLTVHKSKGLESDNVIIINALDNILGFPSQIKDDNVLSYVTSKQDRFAYSEERRLFYVAITRTKNKTYILTKKEKESIFVKELIRDYKNQIEIIN